MNVYVESNPIRADQQGEGVVKDNEVVESDLEADVTTINRTEFTK